MITISDDALTLIEEKKSPIFIDAPQQISGCCIEIVDCPSVSFGVPKILAGYTEQSIQGVTVYVPNGFPLDCPLVIGIKNIFGFKWLAIEGWRLA